jgi:hypothetical protein
MEVVRWTRSTLLVHNKVQWCVLELLVLNTLAGKKKLEILSFFSFCY